ncbi:MAG: RNA polymerase sigma factor [Chitinophagaceae bacterium]
MNERELIQELKNGSEPAFAKLVENCHKRVYNIVLNILQDAADAEDAAQETFIEVHSSISSFKETASLHTWIFRIAVNKAIDKLRKRKRQRRLHQWLPWWMPDEKKSHAADFYHPGIALDKKEKAAVLFKAVESLPEKQRLAFTLCSIQGFSQAEAAEMMGQTIKSVESLIGRAKENLQKLLQEYNK